MFSLYRHDIFNKKLAYKMKKEIEVVEQDHYDFILDGDDLLAHED
ncbi:hypothetical protein [Rhinopithecimicrobium faecis]